MKKFEERIYFHRDDETNWEIEDKAQELGFKDPKIVRNLGYEVAMKVEVSENGNHKVLEIEGVNVSDKEIYI